MNGTGKTLGYLPLNTCNYTILCDWNDHEFIPRWNQENYNFSSINVFLWWSNENYNGTREWEADVLPFNGTLWRLDQKCEW